MLALSYSAPLPPHHEMMIMTGMILIIGSMVGIAVPILDIGAAFDQRLEKC